MAEPMRDGKMVDGKIALSTSLWDTSLEMPPRQDASEVDARDAGTPDNWIKRHPAMLRNTGAHPFNSEAPLKHLQEAGWITPPSLHVVRNHGAVPQLSWSEHELKITGVPKPIDLSMEQIASGEWGSIVSMPVTFICAGNRRKEQNMTKKTVGFDWGAGAVGNSVWTGVRLCDVLAAVGITRPSKEHRFVHFEGPLGELPQGKTGSYGTSIDLGWALDRERDVLLAFKQNGELLTPDHGFPLRTLLPGCIGGRMIKWLSSMWVSWQQESKSHSVDPYLNIKKWFGPLVARQTHGPLIVYLADRAKAFFDIFAMLFFQLDDFIVDSQQIIASPSLMASEMSNLCSFSNSVWGYHSIAVWSWHPVPHTLLMVGFTFYRVSV